MPDDQHDVSFSDGIMAIAKRIYSENGFGSVESYADAASMVLLSIMSAVHAEIGLVLVDGNVKAKEVLGSAIFLYLIGSEIKVLLSGESIEISQAELNVNAGKNMLVIYENERIVEILQRAGEAHDQILQTANDTVEGKEYHHQLGLLTYAYIRSRNEELLKGFTVMRSTIVKMIE